MCGDFQTLQVEGEGDEAALWCAVGLFEEEVEDGCQHIGFHFEVVVSVAIGVDEYLEVRVVVDDGVALVEDAPHVGFFYLGSHIEVVVVPEHLGLGVEARCGMALAADVAERLGPWGCLPVGFVEQAVDGGWLGGVAGYIAARLCEQAGVALHDGLLRALLTRGQEQQCCCCSADG